MSAAARIGAFTALLAVVLAAAAFAGSRISPDVTEGGSHEGSTGEEFLDSHGVETKQADTPARGGHEDETTASSSLPGLAVAQDGYRLVTNERTLAAEKSQSLDFRIQNDDGSTVSDFDVENDRRMHLIVVRRDFQGFQHLHPKQRDDGSWSVEVSELEPGVYRAFANFSTEGRSLTLATDLFVPGRFDPVPLASIEDNADAGEDYEVMIESPPVAGGQTVPTEFEVTLNGRTIDAVEPYLGADGHLVALREGDQAFLHTHPEGEPGGPGPIRFQVTYPTAGRYRLFLQFKHAGEVRTAAFTRDADQPGDDHVGGEQHD